MQRPGWRLRPAQVRHPQSYTAPGSSGCDPSLDGSRKTGEVTEPGDDLFPEVSLFTDDRRAVVEPDRSGSRFTSANVRCAIPVDALTDVLDRPVSFTVPGNRDRRSGSHNRMTCRTGSETRDPCCPVAAGEVRSVPEPAGDRIPVCFGDGERVGNPPAHKTDSRSFRVTASPADNTRRSFDRNLCCHPQITVSVGGPDCLTGEPDNRPVALGTQPASTPTASPTCTRTSSRADDDRTRRHPERNGPQTIGESHTRRSYPTGTSDRSPHTPANRRQHPDRQRSPSHNNRGPHHLPRAREPDSITPAAGAPKPGTGSGSTRPHPCPHTRKQHQHPRKDSENRRRTPNRPETPYIRVTNPPKHPEMGATPHHPSLNPCFPAPKQPSPPTSPPKNPQKMGQRPTRLSTTPSTACG